MTTDKLSKNKLETLPHILERSSSTECCRSSDGPHSVKPLLLAQVERDSATMLGAMLTSFHKSSALELHSSSSRHWRGKNPAVDGLRLVDLLFDITEPELNGTGWALADHKPLPVGNQDVSHSVVQERMPCHDGASGKLELKWLRTESTRFNPVLPFPIPPRVTRRFDRPRGHKSNHRASWGGGKGTAGVLGVTSTDSGKPKRVPGHHREPSQCGRGVNKH